MAVSEGVRRLSLVLGLLVAVPWGLTTGAFFVSTVSAKRDYDREMEIWQRAHANVEGLRRTVEQEAREQGREPRRNLGGPIDLKLLTLAELELRRAELISSRPKPREVEDQPFLIWGFLATPIAFLIPWGAVRVVAWIIEGFRHE